MATVIKTDNAIWAGVTYFNGHPARCQTYISIARKRKFAYLRIRRGDMEIADNGVAWVGNEPSLCCERVSLAALDGRLAEITQGY